MRVIAALTRVSLIALALSACATLPRMDEAENAAGKRFEPVLERGVLYVYRESPFGFAVVLPTSIDGRMIGSLGSDTWYRLEVTPGSHEIACHAENTGKMSVDVAAGEVRFVEVAIQMGFIQPRCRVFVPGDAVGRKSVLGGKRLRPAIE
ncbi:MAG: DUF2846 domain-containing protein [Alphaproteobacteria bacterium]|nr:DUF2846 domain-containing protein [Alphaproteobacteria bacterium]